LGWLRVLSPILSFGSFRLLRSVAFEEFGTITVLVVALSPRGWRRRGRRSSRPIADLMLGWDFSLGGLIRVWLGGLRDVSNHVSRGGLYEELDGSLGCPRVWIYCGYSGACDRVRRAKLWRIGPTSGHSTEGFQLRLARCCHWGLVWVEKIPWNGLFPCTARDVVNRL